MTHKWEFFEQVHAGYGFKCSECDLYLFHPVNRAPNPGEYGMSDCGIPSVGELFDDFRLVVAVDYSSQTFKLMDGVTLPLDSYARCVYPRQSLFPHVAIRSEYPHDCPKCRRPAYVGFNSFDCSGGCK